MLLTERKFTCPALPGRLLHRERLLSMLCDAIEGKRGASSYKLVLLCAPAGYGKTTLLADFARTENILCCWYQLERSDTDLMTFLTSLLTCIRIQFPHFGTTVEHYLRTRQEVDSFLLPPSLSSIIDLFIEELTREIDQRIALILCNYQEVNANPAINDFIDHLLQRLPPQCVLVLESRVLPSLTFSPLLGRREMVGWSSPQLRFTPSEIQEFSLIQGVNELSEQEAEHLASAFDGWIAGLLLGTYLGDVPFLHARKQTRVHVSWKDPMKQMDRHHLLTYIVREVFQGREDDYAFLKEVSIFEYLIPSLCNALLSIENAASRLEHLEQQGLFVIQREDSAQVTYTCHPILRELLMDELHRESPAHFLQLHHIASRLFHASHDDEQAIYHAFEGNTYSLAAEWITEIHQQLLKEGRGETLAHWIDRLPDDVQTQFPRLLLVRAKIAFLFGEQAQAQALLYKAETNAPSSSAGMHFDHALFQAEIGLLRSHIFFRAGEYLQAHELCMHVLAQFPPDEVTLRAEAYTRLGLCENLLGRFSLGIAHLHTALQLHGRLTAGRAGVDIHSALASAYSLTGNFALAEHHLSRAIQCCEDPWGKVENLIRMGLIKQRQGLLEEVESLFLQALALASGPLRFTRGEAYASINLGELYQDEGRYEKALAFTEQGIALARQIEDPYLTTCGLCILAMTYLLLGDAHSTEALLQETGWPQARDGVPAYTWTLCELVYGTMLLSLHRYEEAYSSLVAVDTALESIGLKREQIQAKLRIVAMCLLSDIHMDEIEERLLEVTSILSRQDEYEQVVSRELHHFPVLLEVVKTHQVLGRLYTIPNVLEQEGQAMPEQGPKITPLVTFVPAPQLRIYALGEPSVVRDGVPLTRWRMAKTMEMFFFLLEQERPLRKEQIMIQLWPEDDSQVDQTFRSTLYHLRKVLGESCISKRGDTYRLDLAASYGEHVWCDVQIFQEQYREAKRALQTGAEQHVAQSTFQDLIALYQGDYVSSFYSDWCIMRRDELRRMYTEARQELAVMAWQNAQFDESLFHWQQLLAVDRCSEEAHYGIIKYYVRQGKRSLALRHYQQCCEILHEELAVQPGLAIQKLYQRLSGPVLES